MSPPAVLPRLAPPREGSLIPPELYTGHSVTEDAPASCPLESTVLPISCVPLVLAETSTFRNFQKHQPTVPNAPLQPRMCPSVPLPADTSSLVCPLSPCADMPAPEPLNHCVHSAGDALPMLTWALWHLSLRSPPLCLHSRRHSLLRQIIKCPICVCSPPDSPLNGRALPHPLWGPGAYQYLRAVDSQCVSVGQSARADASPQGAAELPQPPTLRFLSDTQLGGDTQGAPCEL